MDFDRDSARTYRKNFPAARFIERDIRQLKVKDIAPHVSSSKRRRPIVFGACAPCQPFSKQRRSDRRVDARKNLLGEFHRFVRAYLPEYVFIENVPGLQSVDDKEGPFARFLQLLIADRKLTQIKAGEVLGIPQPKVWELVSGGASGFSAERLIHLLNKVGVSVSLAFREEPDWRPGETFIHFDRESDTEMVAAEHDSEVDQEAEADTL
jgi:predicted XRE-type DNA-binding protein